MALGFVIVLVGPRLARWLTARTSRSFGLVLTFAAIAFQFSRAVHWFDGYPYTY